MEENNKKWGKTSTIDTLENTDLLKETSQGVLSILTIAQRKRQILWALIDLHRRSKDENWVWNERVHIIIGRLMVRLELILLYLGKVAFFCYIINENLIKSICEQLAIT